MHGRVTINRILNLNSVEFQNSIFTSSIVIKFGGRTIIHSYFKFKKKNEEDCGMILLSYFNSKNNFRICRKDYEITLYL